MLDSNLYGADIDPESINFCLGEGLPGTFSLISPSGRLPYDDGHFTHILAYSVFTHLSPGASRHWLAELRRVSAPGCVFALTLEPPRFLRFISNGSDIKNEWHRMLFTRFGGLVAELESELTSNGYVFLDTGTTGVYGDAIYTPQYIRREWADLFSLVSYTDDPKQFWQALAFMLPA